MTEYHAANDNDYKAGRVFKDKRFENLTYDQKRDLADSYEDQARRHRISSNEYEDNAVILGTTKKPSLATRLNKNQISTIDGIHRANKAIRNAERAKNIFKTMSQSNSPEARSHRAHIARQNELKAKQDKLKEACEYILDMLDEYED